MLIIIISCVIINCGNLGFKNQLSQTCSLCDELPWEEGVFKRFYLEMCAGVSATLVFWSMLKSI